RMIIQMYYGNHIDASPKLKRRSTRHVSEITAIATVTRRKLLFHVARLGPQDGVSFLWMPAGSMAWLLRY
ncbi:MAG TPA: hypothetical protein VEH06_15320, partial [Candidatus Bathyarchaeia archaeon]|nr:hypothetical protein [Candidatus Bathyarchaeia archaeon]